MIDYVNLKERNIYLGMDGCKVILISVKRWKN